MEALDEGGGELEEAHGEIKRERDLMGFEIYDEFKEEKGGGW